MTNITDWPETLRQISQAILADLDFSTGNLRALITPAQRQAQWLGEAGATETELLAMECRLQITLPPSYRTFLQTTNGFGPLDHFIWRLKTCAEIDWLVKTDADLVELWEADVESVPSVPDQNYFVYGDDQDAGQVRGEYFRELLMVSDWGDAGFLALNPDVQHEGEWEAWHFANWYPGAVRYRSFAALIQAHLDNY